MTTLGGKMKSDLIMSTIAAVAIGILVAKGTNTFLGGAALVFSQIVFTALDRILVAIQQK